MRGVEKRGASAPFLFSMLLNLKIIIKFVSVTKLEILKELSESGVLSNYDKHPSWKKAFEFYWKETGDFNLKMGCPECYRIILLWLRS